MFVDQHRLEVVKLRRQLKAREKKIVLLEDREKSQFAKTIASQPALDGGVFSPRSVRELRSRLRRSTSSPPSSSSSASAGQGKKSQRKAQRPSI